MKCYNCDRDINLIGQDNVSHIPGFPICEDCAMDLTEKEWQEIEKKAREEEYDTNI